MCQLYLLSYFPQHPTSCRFLIPPRTVLIHLGYLLLLTIVGTLAADVDEASSYLMWRTSISLYYSISYLLITSLSVKWSSDARIRCILSSSLYPALLSQGGVIHTGGSFTRVRLFHSSRDEEFQGEVMEFVRMCCTALEIPMRWRYASFRLGNVSSTYLAYFKLRTSWSTVT